MSHVGDKPTLRELLCFKYNGTQHKIHIIYTVASRWRRLGLLLNISNHHLNNIEHNHGNVEDRCQTMLSDWLQRTVGDEPVTWETLVAAIDDAQYEELAQQLKRALSHCGNSL